MTSRGSGSGKSKAAPGKKAVPYKSSSSRSTSKQAKGAEAGPSAPGAGVFAKPEAAEGEAGLKKKELVDVVVERSGVKKKFAKPVIEAMIDVLGEAIANGREVNLQPLGKIKQQRAKDTDNARITVVKIRQSKRAAPALDPADRADADKSKETVADTGE